MYRLISLDAAIEAIDERPYTPAEMDDLADLVANFVDLNGDELICVKQYARNNGQDKKWGFPGYVITKISDNTAQGQ